MDFFGEIHFDRKMSVLTEYRGILKEWTTFSEYRRYLIKGRPYRKAWIFKIKIFKLKIF